MSPETGIHIGKLAKEMGIHRNTLRKYLKDFNIDFQYSQISDEDLDTLIRDIRAVHSDYGIRYLSGSLRAKGHRIQKRRIIESLHRIDSVGIALRTQGRIRRRKYQVTRPQALWHMDGHHKLIRWGIVIHGIIDGYCRTVCNTLYSSNYLAHCSQVISIKACNNNRASTVLDLFLKAVAAHGAPSRGRGDRGGENIKVAEWMIRNRGLNRGSFLWGSYVIHSLEFYQSNVTCLIALQETLALSGFGLK
jgi:hypothetical protein